MIYFKNEYGGKLYKAIKVFTLLYEVNDTEKQITIDKNEILMFLSIKHDHDDFYKRINFLYKNKIVYDLREEKIKDFSLPFIKEIEYDNF